MAAGLTVLFVVILVVVPVFLVTVLQNRLQLLALHWGQDGFHFVNQIDVTNLQFREGIVFPVHNGIYFLHIRFVGQLQFFDLDVRLLHLGEQRDGLLLVLNP
jgi:hypothetical protein